MSKEIEITDNMTFNQMVDVWIQEGTLGSGKVLQRAHELVTDPNKDSNLVRNKIAQLATELAIDESNENPMPPLGDAPENSSADESLSETIKGTYLLSVEIENFRPYYGSNFLSFSTDPEKPITVLLSPDNGSGKTAFLNALSWGLFGELANPNDSRPDVIVNYRALAESSDAEAIVTVKIRIQGTTYTITRSSNKQQASKKISSVQIQEEANGVERTGNMDIFYSYFPRVFRKIFFLAGESINAMSISDTGIENLPFRRGIEVLLRTDDFKRAAEALESALGHNLLTPNDHGDQKITRAKNAVKSAQEKKDHLIEELEQIKIVMEQTQSEIAQLQSQVASGSQEAGLMDEFKQEKEAIGIEEAAQNMRMQKLANFIGNFAHLCHAELTIPSLDFGINRINAAQDAELIPPRFGSDILNKSLETNQCELCGEQLTPNAQARIEAISKFARDKKSSLYATQQRNWLEGQRVRHENKLIKLQEELNDFATSIKCMQADEPTAEWIYSAIVGIRNQLTANERALRERTVAFELKFDEEKLAHQAQTVKILVNRTAALEKQKTRDEKIREEELPAVEEAFAKAEKKLEDLLKDTEADRRVARARHYVTGARTVFMKMSHGLASKGREDLERQMQAIFSEILPDRDFAASVSEDFQIEYTMGNGESAGLSTAQKVLGYGSYAAALSKIAPVYQNVLDREDLWDRAGDIGGTKISSCPIVLDAPTTSMVKENERMFLTSIRELLPQIIITTFVEKDDEDIWSEIADGIGKTAFIYVTGPNMTSKDLHWLGQSHSAAQPDGTLDYVQSTIKEIV